METIEIIRGDGPVILGMPHTGTWLPEDIHRQLNERGRRLADTDWNIHKLYEGLLPGATIVRALFHRYVIDPNRDPSGASLYPGENTTGLVPLTDFEEQDIWETPPTEADIAARRAGFHAPYHAALEAELSRVQAAHGVAVLYDCHSIPSQLPFLFEGTLPDFSIGTNHGATCAPAIEQAVEETCRAAKGFSTVVNGRFTGGWITRHHGRPEQGRHAIQMELTQRTYMEETPPWTYLPERAGAVREPLREMLGRIDRLARDGALK